MKRDLIPMSIPTQSAYIERKAKTTANLLMWFRAERKYGSRRLRIFSSSFALSCDLIARRSDRGKFDAAGVIQLPSMSCEDRQSKL